MIDRIARTGAGLALVLALGGNARATVTQSLSTEFVEVLVEGVPLASRHPVEGRLVDISNKGEGVMQIRVDAVVPMASEMRPGYEPIPDPAWVSFEPRTVEVGPGQTQRVKIVFYTPDDPAQAGRRYQVMLWLHADPAAGSMMALGLKPRLLFSLSPKGTGERPQLVDRPQLKARIEPFQLATETGTMQFACGNLTAINVWDESMTYEVVRDPDAIKRVNLRETETPVPDPSWIEVLPQAVVLPGHSKAELAVTARVPIASEHFGRVYVAALRTVATRAGQKPVDVFNRIRIVVPKLSLTATASGSGVKSK